MQHPAINNTGEENGGPIPGWAAPLLVQTHRQTAAARFDIPCHNVHCMMGGNPPKEAFGDGRRRMRCPTGQGTDDEWAVPVPPQRYGNHPPLLARSGCKGHKNKCSERASQFADCTDGNKSANKPPLNRDPASQRETGSTGVGGIEDCDAAAGLARVRVGFDAMLPSHSFGASWLVGGAGYRPAGASTFSRRARGVVCAVGWLSSAGRSRIRLQTCSGAE